MQHVAPSPHAALRLFTNPNLPCARSIGARYLDLRARGLAHDAALSQAAALLWALMPSLSAPQATGITADIVAAARVQGNG
jgi:hypothetical protein